MADINNTIESLQNVMKKHDKEIDDIFLKLVEITDTINDDSLSNIQKYHIVLSSEYLLYRARVLVESEHLKIKNILSSDIMQTIRVLFTKRDQYLAQVNMKLNTLQSDISNIQKVVYTNSFIK